MGKGLCNNYQEGWGWGGKPDRGGYKVKSKQAFPVQWGPETFFKYYHPQRGTRSPPLDPPLVLTEMLDVLLAVAELPIFKFNPLQYDYSLLFAIRFAKVPNKLQLLQKKI